MYENGHRGPCMNKKLLAKLYDLDSLLGFEYDYKGLDMEIIGISGALHVECKLGWLPREASKITWHMNCGIACCQYGYFEVNTHSRVDVNSASFEDYLTLIITSLD